MDRRIFVGSLATYLLPKQVHTQAIQYEDCGHPQSETCQFERDIRERSRLNYSKWERELNSEGIQIAKKFPGSKVFVAKKGSRRHTIDYSVIPSLDYKHHFLDVQVLPLPDVNGNRATAATVDVWYTKSLGRNHDLIEAQSSFRIKVRQRALRRLKIGGFSTHCAVIYTLKGVRYDDGSGFVGVGNIKPGCNPPPASYDDGLVRGCW